MFKTIITAAVCLALLSCKSKKDTVTKADILAANLDTLVKPADDFFEYANAGWLKKNPIPGEESGWGIGYVVNEENQKRLKDITEQAATSAGAKGSASQMIGDFYTSAMDSVAIEKEGTAKLKPWLDKINSIISLNTFIEVITELNNAGIENVFSISIAQDDKNSSLMSYRLSQGGIGLPERDYYFKTDSSTINIRKAYIDHIAKMLELSGNDSPAAVKASAAVFAFETRLANVSRKLEDLRDPYLNYHKTAVSDLSKLYPVMNWAKFLSATGVKNLDSVIIGQPEFFTALNTILKSTPAGILQNYLRYNLLSDFAGALPNAYGKEAFNFEKLLTGAKEQKPRWKRVINSEQGVMGELLGQLYVKQYFNDSAKQRYIKMAEAIRDAYKERIEKLTWMGDSTKQKALVKLASIKKKIGFPDKWKDFSKMDIGKESYVQNLINADKWWHDFEINKLGKPVDKDEWNMFPQTYNAYYDPGNNEIVFPAAAFIVPGYNDAELDDATMYGYAGASYIGHEITHGFDDQGRLYDEKGNLHNWWTKNDSAAFSQRASVIIKQFSGYEPLPGTHINGKATQGENIADLGGLEIGITAFKKSDAFKKNEIIGGLTPMQRFFLGYALSWQYERRKESLKTQLMTDVHSPEKFRVNGPLTDVDEFYTAFQIKAGDKMYIPDSLRVRIW